MPMAASDLELAWAAGLYDGEGCTSIRASKYAKMSIGQVDREVLERFQAAVGTGKIYGPIKPSKNRGQMWYQFCIDRQSDVKDAMSKIYPYLSSIKRAQANRVFLAVGYPKLEVS